MKRKFWEKNRDNKRDKNAQAVFDGVAFLLALFSGLVLTWGLSSCEGNNNEEILQDVVYRENYDSVYDKIGQSVRIGDVEEREGKAYAFVDGVEYELGMDFLSMAMVYNVQPSGEFATSTAVYNEWWRLFMQRWNMLAPEVPLYSNQYYDVYNAKIDNLQTNPYWDVTDAIISAKVTKGDNAVILGSHTELSGMFRNAAFGKSAAGAADLAVENLTSGYATVTTDKGGLFTWADEGILRAHEERKNADGTKTFTMTIAEDLTFSDGSPIYAKNYVVGVLAGSSKVMREAGGGEAAGQTLVGYEDFNAYEGAEQGTPYFSGVRLLDDYTFSVTVKKEYADYYYALNYSGFSPLPMGLYLGEYDVKDDGNGVYIEKGFYEKIDKNGVKAYKMSDVIKRNVGVVSAATFPYSGPYYVEKYDASAKVATLKRNPYYKGDHRGKASIDRISYVKIVAETQMDQLRQGRVDVLASITGGEETKAALAIVDGVKFKETHYDRAGYGKLAFRCDFGATQFAEVRRAVMHTIDRDEFAQTFTGGYGSVVDAPYYVGSQTYLSVKDKMKLNKYEYNVEKARRELRAGGWVYTAKGEQYNEEKGGVRYKKLIGYEKTYNNLTFASTDNKYKTVKVDGEYYMPLVINWMGTQPNTVTDLLITSWQHNANATSKIGAYITYASGDMSSALYGEYCQMPAYGFRRARYGAVNFATGFSSAAYDQAFSWTIDPNKYDNYSVNFLRDEADFVSNYASGIEGAESL